MPDPEREPDGSHFEGGVIIITEQETIQDLVARVLTEIKTHHYAATTQAGYCSFFYRQLTHMRSPRAFARIRRHWRRTFFPATTLWKHKLSTTLLPIFCLCFSNVNNFSSLVRGTKPVDTLAPAKPRSDAIPTSSVSNFSSKLGK